MRIEHQAANLAAVRNACTELLSFLGDLDAEPSTATCELYGRLRPQNALGRSASQEPAS